MPRVAAMNSAPAANQASFWCMSYLFATHAHRAHTSASTLLETALHACMHSQHSSAVAAGMCFTPSIEIGLRTADTILASGHQGRGLGFLPLSFILYGALVRCPAYMLSLRVTTKHRWTHCGTCRRAFVLPRPLRMRYSAKCFNHFAPSDGTDDIFLEEEKILVTPEPATSTLFFDFLSDSRKDLEKALFMILCRVQRSNKSQEQVTIYNLSTSAKYHH